MTDNTNAIKNVVIGVLAAFIVYRLVSGTYLLGVDLKMKWWRVTILALLYINAWMWLLVPCNALNYIKIRYCPSVWAAVGIFVVSYALFVALTVYFVRLEIYEGNQNFIALGGL